MNFKSISWQQAIIVLGCLAASIAAAKWGGAEAGMITSSVGMIITWLTKSPSDEKGGTPPILPLLLMTCVALGSSACLADLSPGERGALVKTAADLDVCQEAGRAAPDGGHLAAYEACKKDAGL